MLKDKYGYPRPLTIKEWRKGLEPQGHRGIPYLLMTYRLTVPSGREWGFEGLTDFYRDGNTHLWTLRIAECHSMLQEPHGGEPCASWNPHYGYWTDPRPDHYPNPEWARFEAEDGPREGRGTVTLSIRLENRFGDHVEVIRSAQECNMRRDLEPIVNDFPHDIAL